MYHGYIITVEQVNINRAFLMFKKLNINVKQQIKMLSFVGIPWLFWYFRVYITHSL